MQARTRLWRALALSLLAHLPAFWGAALLFGLWSGPKPLATDHLVELVVAPATRALSAPVSAPPRPSAAGQTTARSRQAAVDTLAPGKSGRAGKARAVRRKTQLAGAADKDMRARLRDHLQRDSVARSARKARRDSSRDNRPGRARSPREAKPAAASARRRVAAKLARKRPGAVSARRVEEDAATDRAATAPARVSEPQAQRATAPQPSPAASRGADHVAMIAKTSSDTALSKRHDEQVREMSNSPARSPARVLDLMDLARPADEGSAKGDGSGSVAGRLGNAAGDAIQGPIWLNTADARYVDYFRRVYQRVQPLWHFPRDLALMMEQGDVLIKFTILPDGELQEVEIVKSSGYRRFDSNAVGAIRRAAPFDPVPSELGQRLVVLAPFEFANPMVR